MSTERRKSTSLSARGRHNAVADSGRNPTKTISEPDPAAVVRRMTQDPSQRPATWAVVLAFVIIYLSWGTTFLAIREGVHNQRLPPALFGGTRVALAGLILLAFLAL